MSQTWRHAKDLSFTISESPETIDTDQPERNRFGLTFTEQQDALLDMFLAFEQPEQLTTAAQIFVPERAKCQVNSQ